ncbi:hypothetical protein AHAS_Ahas06G0167400 [Arachis hypogaea]
MGRFSGLVAPVGRASRLAMTWVKEQREGELHVAQDQDFGVTLGYVDHVVKACAGRMNGWNRDDGGGPNGRSVESIGGTRQEQPHGEQEDGGSDSQCLEDQILENKLTWELARESGAVLCNEKDDIMAIL